MPSRRSSRFSSLPFSSSSAGHTYAAASDRVRLRVSVRPVRRCGCTLRTRDRPRFRFSACPVFLPSRVSPRPGQRCWNFNERARSRELTTDAHIRPGPDKQGCGRLTLAQPPPAGLSVALCAARYKGTRARSPLNVRIGRPILRSDVTTCDSRQREKH